MNVDSIVVISFIALAIVWGFWLIFKRDLMSINLGKLVAYFAGVVLTLLLVFWITTRFIPWWALRLITDTRESTTVVELQAVTRDLFSTAVDRPLVIATPAPPTPVPDPPQPVPPPPDPTVSPISPGEPSSSAAVAGERSHVVQSGDTIYRLSQIYGVSQDAIRQRNNLPGDNIRIGQTLIIPAP